MPLYPPAPPIDIFVGALDPIISGVAATNQSVNAGHFATFQVNRAITVTQASIRVGTGGAGNMDLGIYSLSGTTMTRLSSTGTTVVGAGTTVQTTAFTAAVALVPGVTYVSAFSCDNTTPTFNSATVQAIELFYTPYKRATVITSMFPLPASATWATGIPSRLFAIYYS